MSDSLQSHGLHQARILEWVAIPFSSRSPQPRNQTLVSHFAGGFFTSWATNVAQKYWSRQFIPSLADLPDPGIKLGFPALQADSLQAELPGKPNHRIPLSYLSALISQGCDRREILEERSQFMWLMVQCSVFFKVQLSCLYMTTGKTITLTIRTFVSKMVSLLFNILSRFVIAFLQGASIF